MVVVVEDLEEVEVVVVVVVVVVEVWEEVEMVEEMVEVVVLPELVTGLVPAMIVVIITLPGEIAVTDVMLTDLRALVMTEKGVAEDVQGLVVDVEEGVVVVVEEGSETEVVEEVDLVVDEEDMVEIEVVDVGAEEVVDLEDEMEEAEEDQKDLVWTEEKEDLSHIKLAAAVDTNIIDLHMQDFICFICFNMSNISHCHFNIIYCCHVNIMSKKFFFI